MSNTTPNTQTPTNPTNNQNVAVKQLTKEEVEAVAKFNQKKKDKETIRLLNYFLTTPHPFSYIIPRLNWASS